jgi:hypothetical protein
LVLRCCGWVFAAGGCFVLYWVAGMTREVLQQALDAMEQHGAAYLGHLTEYRKAIAAAKAALAQPVQPEPWTPEDTAYRPGGLSQAEQTHSQNPKFTMDEWAAHARKHQWRFDEEPVTGVTTMAQPEQGPVAWGIVASNTGRICQVTLDADEVAGHKPEYIKPLYTSPPQRQPLVSIEMLLDWKSQVNEIAARTNKAERHTAGAALKRSIADVISAHGIGEKT